MTMPDDFIEQMKKFFKNMKPEDRQKMMGDMKMSDMMPMMIAKMMGDKNKGGMPCMGMGEDFKPWEFCPCKDLCRKGFETKAAKGDK